MSDDSQSTHLTRLQRQLLSACVQLLRHYSKVAENRVERATITYALGIMGRIGKVLDANDTGGPAAMELLALGQTTPEKVSRPLQGVHRIASLAAALLRTRAPEPTPFYTGLLREIAEHLLHPIDPSSRYPEEFQRALSRRAAGGSPTDSLSMPIYLDLGDATADDIRDALVALSDLHRAAGGGGLRFTVDNDRILVAELA